MIPQITHNINKFFVLESVGKSRICTQSVPWLADSYKLEVISRIFWLVVTVGPLPSTVFLFCATIQPSCPASHPALPKMAPKTSNTDWKLGEQLEFLLSRESSFKSCQDNKTLGQFWLRVFDVWYTRWLIPTPTTFTQEQGSPEAAWLMLQKDKNLVRDSFCSLPLYHPNLIPVQQIKTWFNNRGRGGDSKTGCGNLKLDVSEKRKLAPVKLIVLTLGRPSARSSLLIGNRRRNRICSVMQTTHQKLVTHPLQRHTYLLPSRSRLRGNSMNNSVRRRKGISRHARTKTERSYTAEFLRSTMTE